MSGKLDKGLDELVTAQRKTAGRRRTQRRNAGRPAAAAPAGGIQKAAKPARGTAAKPAKAAAVPHGDSKVIVSNLVSILTAPLMTVPTLTAENSPRMLRSSRSRYVSVEAHGPPDLFDLFFLAILQPVPEILDAYPYRISPGATRYVRRPRLLPVAGYRRARWEV